MNYTFITSLEHRTLIKLATALWNTEDVWDSISRFDFPLVLNTRVIEWQQTIETKVIEKVSKLPSAKPLKEKLLYFIRPVGFQILAWVEFHVHRCSFVKNFPCAFFWTAQGTIDKVKTAEVLVNDESLSIYERYKLACIYCFEDYIHVLWKRGLPYKEDLVHMRIQKLPLVSFWSHNLEENIAQLDNIMKEYCENDNVTLYEYAFQLSALGGNEAATRYFFQKLTPEEKENILVRTAGCVANRRWYFFRLHADFPNECYTDVLCFCLLQMDEGQQLEVFKSYPYGVLKCFLDWPWQIFFMETAEHMWDFLSEEDYYLLLCNIIDDKFTNKRKDLFNYQELFGEFWQRSPRTHKKYVINSCILGRPLLLDLFNAESEENIKLIFNDAIASERENLIFSRWGIIICKEWIYGGKWDLLEFFVRMCLSSKDLIIKFEEELKKNMNLCSKRVLKIKKDMWNKFFQLLNDFSEKAEDKESVEEGNSNPTKRFYSLTNEQLATLGRNFKGKLQSLLVS